MINNDNLTKSLLLQEVVGDFGIGNKKVMGGKGKAKYCGATIKKYIYFKMLQEVRRLRDGPCSWGNGRFLRNDSGVRFWC